MIKNSILEWIDVHQQDFKTFSERIWDYAETGLQEYRSSKLFVGKLEKAGFEVQVGLADMPTSIVASYGEDKPIIAVLGEFDALPGLSQKPIGHKEAVVQNAAGHGCGHNHLGTAALAAALAVKEQITAGKLIGTIRFYGCPAEENFNAKGYMVKAGLFADVDIALTWHPASINAVPEFSSTAIINAYFNFYGIAAHAAGDPQNGRSALDAVELMNVGCNYLREHMSKDARLHYAITNGGGAPNVVPAEAEVWYFVRSPQYKDAKKLFDRVVKVAKGAAMMTETDVEVDLIAGTYNTAENDVVHKVLYENMLKVGPQRWTKEDLALAQEIGESLPPGSFDALLDLVPSEFQPMAKELFKKPLCDVILPPFGKGNSMGGSTDVGDVSWILPTGQFVAATEVMGSPGHSWQNVAAGRTGIGHKGMLLAAKTLALSAVDFLTRPDLIRDAWDEFTKAHEEDKYESPFADDAKPPFHRLQKDILQYPELD